MCFHLPKHWCVGEGEELPGVLYGDTDIVDATGRFLHHRRLQPPAHLSWRSFRWGMLVCHQSFYARTDLAKGIHYNLDYRFSADVDWCIRVMKESARLHLPLRNVGAVVASSKDKSFLRDFISIVAMSVIMSVIRNP